MADDIEADLDSLLGVLRTHADGGEHPSRVASARALDAIEHYRRTAGEPAGCPECGGRGARGCGAGWHDGRPDAPSPLAEPTAAPTCPTRAQAVSESEDVVREWAEDERHTTTLACHVLDVLNDLDKSRRTAHLIGGALVEASKSFTGLAQAVLTAVADGGSSADVIEVVVTWLDGGEALDDNNIALYERAKSAALLAGEGTAQPDPSEIGACTHPVDWNDPHMRHKAPCAAVNWPENCNADACSCERICLACCTRCGPQTVVAHYLVAAPEQGDWEWEDHCDGMAGGIVDALRSAGHLPPLGEVGDGAF